MLKLQSVFSEEELDGDSLDTDELGFTNHINVNMTMGNGKSFLLSHFTEVYKLQCFESHKTYCKLSHSVLWAPTDDMEKFMIVYQKKNNN